MIRYKRCILLLLIGVLMCLAISCNKTREGENEIKIITHIIPSDYYQDGYTYNSIVGIDEYGRTILPAGGYRDGEHEIGIFYFGCMGGHDPGAIYDTTKILQMENGLELLIYQDTEISKAGAQHFWAEPLYGYYNSEDKWVIRKHLELFIAAGIDFLFLDITNGVTYDRAYTRLMEVICELKAEGWENVPQVAYYTNVESMKYITQLYNTIYKRGKNQEAWYYMDGKPLIIAKLDPDAPVSPKNQEILDFFTIRDSQWPNEPFLENGFPWMEWTYPAPVHNGIINVCVAAHPAACMSTAYANDVYGRTDNGYCWGRGWDVDKEENIHENIGKGTFYQSTWDVALEEDPRMITITGWNEWTASKFWHGSEYVFVDTFNMEYSRDAEIMKGGFNDSFYIQTAINSRTYKSNLLNTNSRFAISSYFDIENGSWDDIKAVFRDIGTVNEERDYIGSTKNISYQEPAARNNLSVIKVATDGENIYFRIESTEDITAREEGDSTWMNIFIGTGNVKVQGWESYEYVINRNITQDGKGSIEKLNADFSGTTLPETADYTIEGNVMIVTVPRSALGLAPNQNIFYFKVADNITEPDDIMDYYVSGKSLPVGRLSYQYLGE